MAAESCGSMGGGEDDPGKSETEKRERQQQEREAMRQAVAAYTGPVTKCPPGKVARERHGWPRRHTPEKARTRNSENTPR